MHYETFIFTGKRDIAVIIAVTYIQRRQVENLRAFIAPDDPLTCEHRTIMITYFHACRSDLPSDGPHFITVRFCANRNVSDATGRRVRFVHIAAIPVRRPGFPVLDAKPCSASFIVSVVIHVIQPGRPGHGHIDAVTVLHIRRAHDRLILGQGHVDGLVGDGAAEKRYRPLVIGAGASLYLHIAKILDRRVADTDVVDAFNRPVATTVQDVQILVVLVLIIAVRRFDVIHKELWRRDTLAKGLADDAAFLGLYVRQLPAISR